jgi:hypothetical protein
VRKILTDGEKQLEMQGRQQEQSKKGVGLGGAFFQEQFQ